MFHIIHHHKEIDTESLQSKLQSARQKIIKAATCNIPSRLDKAGKEQLNEVANMAKRFRKHGDAYFEFISTPGVEPTNNFAEQAIRFIVIDRHITQGTRSTAGQTANERLWSIIGTCAIQGKSAFDFILSAVKAHFHDRHSPSLIPNTS